MVAGRLKCLGSSQRLKHKFGASYEVNLHCPEDHREASLQHLLEQLRSTDVNVEVEEEHRTYFRLRVGHGVDLSMAFGVLEGLKARGGVSEYSLSQSTLEQIFINFAKKGELAADEE